MSRRGEEARAIRGARQGRWEPTCGRGQLLNGVQALLDGGGVAQGVGHPGAQLPRPEHRQRVVQQPQQRAVLAPGVAVVQDLQLPAELMSIH